LGFTGPEQQAPLVVRLAAGQHEPLPAGTRPDEQQRGPIGILINGTHWLLLMPSGISPLGQHTPVEVIWLDRQHEPPVDT